MAYNIILAQATVIAFSFIVFTNSLDINVQPQFVRPNDQNVVLTCAGGNDTKKTSEKMFRMRLMKLDDNEQWIEMAVLRFDGSIDKSDVNATVDGRLGNVLDSHLVVTWPVAPDHINGRYRCDAMALTSTGDVVTKQSRDLDVKSVSTDLSYLLERLKKSEKKVAAKVDEAMRSTKTELFSLLDSMFTDLKEYLDNKTAVNIRIPKENEETMLWPEGNFTLLMPKVGCPLYPPAWVKNFMKIKAYYGDKYYPIDIPLHLSSHYKQKHFITRQFCTLPASPERYEQWPVGTYCLSGTDLQNMLDCPSGFKKVKVNTDMKRDKGNFWCDFFPAKYFWNENANIYTWTFCCRHDGNATTPIALPVTHPFYLVRHRGRCQEVQGMDVTQDMFMMETLYDSSYTKWLHTNKDFRPDVTLFPYKEELCYYSRRK